MQALGIVVACAELWTLSSLWDLWGFVLDLLWDLLWDLVWDLLWSLRAELSRAAGSPGKYPAILPQAGLGLLLSEQRTPDRGR